ncbi:MAG: hypothetical protein LJE83_13245 [Gammaproteobacteria bacterium]|nr:hypothetical protein [Gammaproteobacteria bacterium]
MEAENLASNDNIPKLMRKPGFRLKTSADDPVIKVASSYLNTAFVPVHN